MIAAISSNTFSFLKNVHVHQKQKAAKKIVQSKK